MRVAFIETLTELAAKDKSIYLLTGDLGYSVFENFAAKFPKRFLNCGVAEQNMMGTAAGLALSGKKVFVYSIIPFLTMRCFEQVRNDVCLHNLDVKLVGVGGGYSYGQLGPTHHAVEDIAIMRSLPNMTVLCPADPAETKSAIQALLRVKGPTYLRLGKSQEENLHKNKFKFRIGKADVLRSGRNATIIGMGPILKNALAAAEALALEEKLSVRVVSMATVKPIDSAAILAAAKTTKALITLEEHNVHGGLGDAVATVLAESGLRVPFLKLGVGDYFAKIVGDQQYLVKAAGLSPVDIKRAVCQIWKSRINTK